LRCPRRIALYLLAGNVVPILAAAVAAAAAALWAPETDSWLRASGWGLLLIPWVRGGVVAVLPSARSAACSMPRSWARAHGATHPRGAPAPAKSGPQHPCSSTPAPTVTRNAQVVYNVAFAMDLSTLEVGPSRSSAAAHDPHANSFLLHRVAAMRLLCDPWPPQ
jgi:hypothetical protein